jgi:ribosomal subunit interface protein
MLIEIRALSFDLTDAIYRHVETRIESALGPFGRRVLGVTVRLDDVNAGRGGIDKRCRIVATLRRHGIAVAEATKDDLYSAIDDAAARIRRIVVRQLSQHVGRERKDPQRPGAMVTLLGDFE